MPLSKIQRDILQLLASHRDPESYVAGSTPLTRNTLRYSTDIDGFQDNADRIQAVASSDASALLENGYAVRWLRQDAFIHTLSASRQGRTTRLDWVADSDFRFFPTMKDPTFGYTLHPVNMAMNKAHAAAGRRELRDIVDLVAIHERFFPWAP